MADDGGLLAETFGHFDNELERLGATQAAYDEQSKSAAPSGDLAKNNVTAMAIELSHVARSRRSRTCSDPSSDLASGLGDMPGPMQVLVVGTGLLVTSGHHPRRCLPADASRRSRRRR